MLKRSVDIESLRVLLKVSKKADITILDEAPEPFGTVLLVKTLIKEGVNGHQTLVHFVTELYKTKETKVLPLFDSNSENLGGHKTSGAPRVLGYKVTHIDIKKLGAILRTVFYSITVLSEGGYQDHGDPHWRSGDLEVRPFEPYVRIVAVSDKADLNRIIDHMICTSPQ